MMNILFSMAMDTISSRMYTEDRKYRNRYQQRATNSGMEKLREKMKQRQMNIQMYIHDKIAMIEACRNGCV